MLFTIRFKATPSISGMNKRGQYFGIDLPWCATVHPAAVSFRTSNDFVDEPKESREHTDFGIDLKSNNYEMCVLIR